MTSKPQYLTGDKAAINEFIDKFDVRDLLRCQPNLSHHAD